MSFFGFPRGRNKALNTVRIVLTSSTTANLYYDSGFANGQTLGTPQSVSFVPGTPIPIYATGGTGTATSTATVVNNVEVFDSFGSTARVQTGSSGSQVDLFLDYPGGNGFIPVLIQAGTQLWFTPITAPTFTAGATPPEITINFYD